MRHVSSILTLEKFSTATSRGTTYLLQQIPHLVERCDDHRLKGEYIATLFESYEYLDIPDPSGLAVKGIQEFKLANDPLGEGTRGCFLDRKSHADNVVVQLYNILGSYYLIKHEDVETALAYFRRALSLSVRIGDSNGETKAFMHLAEVEWTKGNNGQSQKYAQLAQQAARLSGHLLAEAHSIKPEITCLTSMGHFKRSIELCIRARELLGLCGMRGGFLDVSLMNLEGDIHFRKSEFLESRSLHVQILEKTGKDQSPIEYAYAQLNIAFVDSAIGADEETVHQSLDVARAMFTSLGSPGGIAYCDLIVSDLQLRQGLKVEPREFYERCISKYRFRDDMAILCLDKLSDLTYGLNNISDTFAYALVLLGFGKKSPDMVAIHTSFRCLGDIFSAQGDEATAIALFTVALEGFTHMDIHLGRAECMVRLGDFAITHGDIAKAKVLWTDARPLYERSSQAGKISSVDERLNSLP
jgi:tetratricopeptide (TPR) repeat protein